MKTKSNWELQSKMRVLSQENSISQIINQSFRKISPFWPLKNIIAVNPLHGLEDLPIEDAIKIGAAHFQQAELPEGMQAVNRHTIKWLQVYFDEGQAKISMPLRNTGLYPAWKKLSIYDSQLLGDDAKKKVWLQTLPEKAEQAIELCLSQLHINNEQYEEFITLLLTTLSGWASYIKYRTEWCGVEKDAFCPVTKADYLAIRLILVCLIWPEAKILIDWYKQALESNTGITSVTNLFKAERTYRIPLLKQLAQQSIKAPHTPEAQLVFCIDVRSEPFRKALEQTGDYQTFGFAGFFGVPVKITNTVTGESVASCPVLLSPKHDVKEVPCDQGLKDKIKIEGQQRLNLLKYLYYSLKYTFTAPLALAEFLGFFCGIWMGLRNFSPRLASAMKTAAVTKIQKPFEVKPLLEAISFTDQCFYAENALKMIGLTKHFAKLIVLCGHGSTTLNNAFATALDCGACGGQHGASNARILASILNSAEIKNALATKGIIIPPETCFIAAEHNTTTDEVTIYAPSSNDIEKLKKDLEKAREINSFSRLQQMKKSNRKTKAVSEIYTRSQDWAQVRPEWGLARNAAFIIAPRDITSCLNLEGRCFLHSYDHTLDPKGDFLTVILTAPMIVAEWINTQYLFSTLDNVAYGAGSKITKNIAGKIGIMQGNASDLMTGLPLQSLYNNDIEAYHEPQRLMTVVYAPRQKLELIIRAQPILIKLFGNGWVQLACIDPDSHRIYLLNRNFTWENIQ